MARVEFGVNDPAARKVWATALDAATIANTISSSFTGKGSRNLCEERSELENQAGDRIRFHLRDVPVEDPPKVDGQILEDNEIGMTVHYDDLYIGQSRQAIKVPWENADAQRVPWNIRGEGKSVLEDYWAREFDEYFFRHLCGWTPGNYDNLDPATGTLSVANNFHNTILNYEESDKVYPASEPDSTNEDDDLDSGDIFTLAQVERAVVEAKTRRFRLRTLNVPGFGPCYVCFLHPFQTADLRNTSGTWYADMRAAMQGGMIKDNPIFTGALGFHNGVLFVESEYVTTGVDEAGAEVTDVRRAVLCGAQALIKAKGRFSKTQTAFNWIEEFRDYEEWLGIGTRVMGGIKRAVYDGVGYGSILLPTYAVDPNA